MFCQNCGNQLPEGSTYCPSCGKPISEYQETSASDAPDYSTNNTFYYTPEPETPETSAEPEQKLRPDGYAIAALCLSIASLLCCCIVYLQIPVAIAGLVFGILGVKSNQKVMAIVSIVISAISLVLGITMLISSIVFVASGGFKSPEDIERYINDLFNR